MKKAIVLIIAINLVIIIALFAYQNKAKEKIAFVYVSQVLDGYHRMNDAKLVFAEQHEKLSMQIEIEFELLQNENETYQREKDNLSIAEQIAWERKLLGAVCL